MRKYSIRIEEKTGIEYDSLERFVVFVATKERPIISFANFARAERLAIFFAGLTNVKMEVFDSESEISYIINPSDAKRLSVH